MKKGLLLAMAVALGFCGFAQNRAVVSTNLENKSVKAEYNAGTDNVVNLNAVSNPTTAATKMVVTETQIGSSKYDLQTNKVFGERAYMAEDGQMGVVWTIGNEDTDFPDRGTGYNFFDGSSWGDIPTTRVEEARTGWPSIAQWGDGEVLTSHGMFEGDYPTLGLMTRPVRGEGDWNLVGKPTSLEGAEYVWNRIATSGSNNDIIHVISDAYTALEGQDVPVLYNRTSDGGQTWDAEDVIIEQINSDHYKGFSADDYKIVAKGNTVCIFFVSSWYDLFYLRSDDNGSTWEKQMVWEHPYPMFDWDATITNDTIWGPDGGFDAQIDNNGDVHMAFTLTRVVHTEVGTSYNYFPYTDGVVYWNDGMDEFTNANQHYALSTDNLIENVNLIGWVPDMNDDGELTLTEDLYDYRTLGMSTMPTIHLDANNDIFVLWSAQAETLIFEGETQYNYKHVFGRTMVYGEWQDIIHLTSDFLHSWDECIYPSIIGSADEKLHFFFNIDNTPGLAMDDEHPYLDNRITYAVVDYSDFGINVENVVAETSFVVSQNYPNPTSGTTSFDVTVSESSDVIVEVVNMVGQVVISNVNTVNAGQNTIQLNVNDLNAGVYFYTVKAGAQKITRKMIIE